MVPGRSGGNIPGRTYDASAGQTFSSPDTIRFERTGPRSFQNVTAGDHIFHSGTVRGEILGSSKHGFFLLFVGAGTNTNKLLAYINQAFGKSLFDEQAAKVKYQLKLTCGG
jgi:hypothetical protein